MQQFIRSVGRIAAADAALLRRFPRYLLAVVPSLYALIYLTSVWDPNANTHALPVAIVNLDAGLQYRGHAVNVGAELTKVLVILSEGNNYASAGFARRFAEDLGHQVNETLNEQRWEQVLISADGSGKSLDTLRDGMAQLKAGLQELESGLARNNALAAQWAAGVRQAGVIARKTGPCSSTACGAMC